VRWLAALALAAAVPLAGAEPRATLCGVGVPGERPAGLDADRDGVPDSDDWCVGSLAGARVGSNGCADWEVPARCERVPAPAAAPAAPAAPPVDSDGDGVADPADRCTGTPAGATVIANGCVDVNTVVLKGTSFEVGSVTLLPEAHRTLRLVSDAMRANRKLVVEVGGHTDSVGDARVNQRLSHRRAQAIRLFLVSEGVAPERLSATGYGETRPIADNQTAAGRAENRRVEFKVIRGGG
jgi:OOP family OmpA-OmpF porin